MGSKSISAGDYATLLPKEKITTFLLLEILVSGEMFGILQLSWDPEVTLFDTLTDWGWHNEKMEGNWVVAFVELLNQPALELPFYPEE
jgi:hypothetical protein